MFLDLRYHLTTIIAIFLSLGIGILIGTALIGDDGIVMEQQKIIAQIEDDLQTLRLQNNQFRTMITALEIDLAEQEQFIDQLFQDAIAETLSGLSCLWVKGEDDSSQLMTILQNTGLEITPYSAAILDKSVENNSSEGDISTEEKLDMKGAWEDDLLNWDLCIVLAQGVPGELENNFTNDRIFKPVAKNLNTKKGIYQFVKSLNNLKLKIQGDKENDFGGDTSL